jgi:hypothetical protein
VHVHWLDFESGAGRYQSANYKVVSAATPARVLTSGRVGISGRWGAMTSQSGNLSVTCDDGRLGVWRYEHVMDATTGPRPLARKVEPDPEVEGASTEPMYVSEVGTRAHLVYAFQADAATLRLSELQYRSRAGDTLAEVVAALRIEPEWISSQWSMGQQGAWIDIVLPAGDARRRFPPLPEPP